MDRDTLEIVFRFLISVGITVLMFQGKMQGVYGGFYITVIMGIDIAALIEAIRTSQLEK